MRKRLNRSRCSLGCCLNGTKESCVRWVGLGRFGFFKFGSIRFRFQSQVLGFGFFGFRICTPPQCKSIPLCENTNTESTNFDKKFHLKHTDRPRWVWRSYSSHYYVMNSSQFVMASFVYGRFVLFCTALPSTLCCILTTAWYPDHVQLAGLRRPVTTILVITPG